MQPTTNTINKSQQSKTTKNILNKSRSQKYKPNINNQKKLNQHPGPNQHKPTQFKQPPKATKQQ